MTSRKTAPSGLFRKGRRLIVPEVPAPVAVEPEPAAPVEPSPVVEPAPPVEVQATEPEPQPEVEPAPEPTPDLNALNVAQVLEWVGDDDDRKAIALANEAGREKPRKGIVDPLS